MVFENTVPQYDASTSNWSNKHRVSAQVSGKSTSKRGTPGTRLISLPVAITAAVFRRTVCSASATPTTTCISAVTAALSVSSVAATSISVTTAVPVAIAATVSVVVTISVPIISATAVSITVASEVTIAAKVSAPSVSVPIPVSIPVIAIPVPAAPATVAIPPSTSSSPTTVTVTIPASTSTSVTTAFSSRNLYTDRATIDFRIRGALDSILSIARVIHSDKRVSARTTRIAIHFCFFEYTDRKRRNQE
mmetsp:Transcript_32952/g.55533  ORF Transcript_32952/g.55533 Transcript_32952/m.55533 type:complete len:249 (+) Transcript_32952:137-883(+)